MSPLKQIRNNTLSPVSLFLSWNCLFTYFLMGSKSKRYKKTYKEKSISHPWEISHRPPQRKTMLIRQITKIVTVLLPPSIHTSLLYDLEASPIKRWRPLPHPSNVGRPLDLPWPAECGRCDQMPVPSLGLERCCMLPLFLSEICWVTI